MSKKKFNPVVVYRVLFSILLFVAELNASGSFKKWFFSDGILRQMNTIFGDGFFIAAGAVLVAATLALAVGFLPRIAAALVFSGLAIFQARDPLIVTSTEKFLTAMSFFMIWAPLTAAEKNQSPWPLRLMRFQLVLAYLTLLIIDLKAAPSSMTEWLICAVEGALVALPLFKKTRKAAVFFAVGFHLGQIFSGELPLFQLTLLSSWILFWD